MIPQITVVVLSFAREPWLTIERDGQRRTWCVDTEYPLPTRFVYGPDRGLRFQLTRAARGTTRRLLASLPGCESLANNVLRAIGSQAVSRPITQSGDRIFTGVPEGWFNTNAKTIAAFRYLLAHDDDFDFLFRTNTSTYVHRGRLQEHLSTAPRSGYYAGPIWNIADTLSGPALQDGLRYASGTGIALSRDLVELVVSDPQWEYELVDDIALGRCMRRFGVQLQSLPRVIVETADELRSLSKSDLADTFIVRCKGRDSRDHDIAAMLKVHQLYVELDEGTCSEIV